MSTFKQVKPAMLAQFAQYFPGGQEKLVKAVYQPLKKGQGRYIFGTSIEGEKVLFLQTLNKAAASTSYAQAGWHFMPVVVDSSNPVHDLAVGKWYKAPAGVQPPVVPPVAPAQKPAEKPAQKSAQTRAATKPAVQKLAAQAPAVGQTNGKPATKPAPKKEFSIEEANLALEAAALLDEMGMDR